MKIKCPRCKSDLEVDAVGDFVACFHCSLEFTVDESTVDKSTVDKPKMDETKKGKIFNTVLSENQPVAKPSPVLTMPVRTSEPNYVIVTDIRMNFMSMVEFMVKWVLASIPAFMIIGFVFIFFLLLFRGFTGK
jgi:transposase-like protein